MRRFQAAAERPDTVSLGGGLCFKSPFSPFLSICPPSLAHCLDPDRKPGRLGPESERRLFLLLCDCFLFTPAASLHALGGPVLIRVPACSRAVPEGCGRRVPEWEEGKIKKKQKRGGGLGSSGSPFEEGTEVWAEEGKWSSPRWSKDSVEEKKNQV